MHIETLPAYLISTHDYMWFQSVLISLYKSLNFKNDVHYVLYFVWCDLAANEPDGTQTKKLLEGSGDSGVNKKQH